MSALPKRWSASAAAPPAARWRRSSAAALAAISALLVLVAFSFPSASASAAAAPPTNICGANATLAAHVLSVLNLTQPALATVTAAAARGDMDAACEALAAYYASSATAAWWRRPAPAPSSRLVGGVTDEMVFNDTFYLAGVGLSSRIPRNADGGLDWTYRGPRFDYEFLNCLNRHDSFGQTLTAWLATGNPVYPAFFDALVLDWSSHNPCPGAALPAGVEECVPQNVSGAPTCSWRAPGELRCVTGFVESPWRSLEMGIRMVAAWPQAFFGFQRAPEFSTSSRVLMLLAVGEHFAALAVDKMNSGMANWAVTQLQGLVTATVAFPELARADELREYALVGLEAQLVLSVYPDGVETEQSSGYDMVTAQEFWGAIEMLELAGAPPPPSNFSDRLELMFDYSALSADPLGCLPRNGDSDVCNGGYNAGAATYFQRKDWTYAATNGAQGEPPDNTAGPSRVWPWSGQVVMRSGWERNASWVWLDVGPYASSGHGDRDKLSLNLHARGAMLLVDAGRFAYVGNDLSGVLRREYQKFARAHNTLVFDACDQLPTPGVVTAPLAPETVRLAPAADSAWGNMSAFDPSCLNGSVTHTRGVVYTRAAGGASADGDGDFVVVVDGVRTDRDRGVEAFWHAHPNATGGISLNASTLVATVGGATFAFEPSAAQACVVPARAGVAGAAAWSGATVVKGQVRNDTLGLPWQGWFSASYDAAFAAPVTVYSARAPAGATAFAWLIVPTAGHSPCGAHAAVIVAVARDAVVVAVSVAGAPPANVTVPMAW